MRATFVSAVLTLLLILPSLTPAQISEAEIDSLREVGKREGWTFTIGQNPASERPIEQLCGLAQIAPDTTLPILQFAQTDLNLPTSFDWRELGGVTPVKNQANCGSCWAFANNGVLESVIKIKDGLTLDLSEQWLVSCNVEYWSCERGGIESFEYSLAPWNPAVRLDQCGGFGVVLEEELPYTAQTDPCECRHRYEYSHFLESWGYAYRADLVAPVDIIKQAIMRYGPVYTTVYATGEFMLYSDGVFNRSVIEQPNHAVVLVGWDDNLGTEGAWILRNSWGPGWGMSGYMYIEYGCSNVGMRTCWVDYYLPEVVFWSDTTYGEVPLAVDFSAYSPKTAESWNWDFGDGGTADSQTPSHTYISRGAYDVGVEMTSDGRTYSTVKPMFIAAIADTVLSRDVSGEAGGHAVVTLSAHNAAPVRYFKLPVEYGDGEFPLLLDSFSTVGCRTDYFERQEYVHYDPWFGRRVTVKLISSDYETSPELPPGEGDILKLYFTIPASTLGGETAEIELNGYDAYIPEFQGSKANYAVPTVGCRIACESACCLVRGDVDHDGTIDNADIVYIIDWAFSSGANPPCPGEADVDGQHPVNIDDLLYLIDYVFQRGPSPPACQ